MNPEKFHFNYTPEQQNAFLKGAGAICLTVLTLLLIVKTMTEVKIFATTDANKNGIQNVISVSGKSEMDVKPDLTVLTFSSEGTGKTAEDAQDKSAEMNNKAIAFVKEKGIKEADIKTDSYNTYPRYEQSYKNCPGITSASGVSSVRPAIEPAIYPPCTSGSVITGYTTNQSVTVKIRDIDKNPKLASEIVAGLGQIGVTASLQGSTIDNIEEYKKVVRDEAIIKARREAERLAKALGVKLVKITSFNENGMGGYPYAMDYISARPAMAEKAAIAPEMPTGTNKVTSEVTITYEIR